VQKLYWQPMASPDKESVTPEIAQPQFFFQAPV
jgi:hypothetical protein